MASVYVHYCVDPFGVTDLHFSGSRSNARAQIYKKDHFNLAVTGIAQIPSGKKKWEVDEKIWHIDSEYWFKIKNFFDVASTPTPEMPIPIFELCPYSTPAMFRAFMLGTKPDATGTVQPDNIRAQSFFNNFNQAIERTAVAKSDKDMLAELLGLKSLREIDGLDSKALKTLYRSAAIKWHPDRNAGDGSKMTDLNALWRTYVQPTL
jgi:hypothetical protein